MEYKASAKHFLPQVYPHLLGENHLHPYLDQLPEEFFQNQFGLVKAIEPICHVYHYWNLILLLISII